jgi:hypothetical protein
MRIIYRCFAENDLIVSDLFVEKIVWVNFFIKG